ncbi:hypothetical protein C2G38_2229634 [Gigaspora rosea]|uniref:Uncharacterized protein n=1 Tax=Gigaspora rosea TaxID=44941 RepID=A0A397TUV7_9GLOM|nr:hypothetical protein C2G38_2229634 [Gigaspora rosea]
MTFVPVVEAYEIDVSLDMKSNAHCRIWIEDINHNRIAGDGKGDYHFCDNGDEIIDIPDQEYWVVAKVRLSARKQKYRGTFNGNTCFRITGDEVKFHFDEISCN